MHTITLSNGKFFFAEAGESILDAAARQSISLCYSCNNGRCGSCKGKLLSGTTSCISPEIGLTDKEKKDGYILNCMRIAESDVILDAEEIGPVELPEAKITPCRIDTIKPLASNTLEVTLRLPPANNFHFIPGQYIDVMGVNGLCRSYSIANSQNKSNKITLHIRAVKHGIMSNYWFNQAKSNDLLRFNGPLGTFFLRDTANIDLIFLATGTGIAPVKSILESLAENPTDQCPRSITVFWGGRVLEDLYFNIANIPLKLKFIPVLSRANADWSGYHGYVQQALLDTFTDLKNAAVYACGSDIMIRSAKETLTSAGLPDNRFYSDAFVCSGNSKPQN